jgi:signal transduction histidine kinase
MYAWLVVLGVDAGGTATGLIGIVHDVTERKKAETALREADARKTEFLATLSHELRNPLAPIRYGLTVLDQAPPRSEQAKRAREILERQVTHLTRWWTTCSTWSGLRVAQSNSIANRSS